MSETPRKKKRDPAEIDRLIEAGEQWHEEGKSRIACDQCQGIIEFERLSAEVFTSRCPCGKYDCTFKGI